MTTRHGSESRTDADGSNATFGGYRRADGSIGVRNHVLVLPSVICSHVVADRIAERVPGARSTPHDHGCAQLGADNEQTRRTFLGLAANPNVAGTLVVGLGCEEVQSDDVAAALAERDRPVRELSIQGVGGTEECLAEGTELARELVASAGEDRRESGDLGDLTLGIVCSDVRDSSVEEADPLVGRLADTVTGAGGRVVAAGVDRLVPHEGATALAADESTAMELGEVLAEYRRTPARSSHLRQRAADRSLESLARAWGDQPVQEVVRYGDRATHDAGLAVVDAPSRFAEAATGLAAAGAQAIVHVTGDGVPTGHPIVPVIKVTGDDATYAALSDDIDVSATDAAAEDLLERLLAVLDGNPSAAERHGLAEFAINRIGPSM